MKKKDKKALFLIYQGVDESTFEKIVMTTTSKEVWKILAKTFTGVKKIKKIHLQIVRNRFESLYKEESKSISNYFTRILVIVN
ncbi:hypothetical protein AXF42_Ash020946 [Apostasia shenzhenica]|uniref:Retrovirus-related Pol polyprotein from transposon TNT 1-94 n=1 Tax=Apostasia shenzhenica TaxID=1088818 RepID=A0A2H9ZYQ2_9ASPA|nr:hypothetical protein AXF42_Ash020946 [Apostasia shenzhenica]